MLKVWGRKNSSNVRKVLWCVEELALPYEREEAGGAFGVVDSSQYRALNPNGRVPMLEDDGFVLWESNVIVRYIAAQYGSDTSWYQNDNRVRAQADKWMDWTSTSFAVAFRDVFWGILRTPAAEQDWAKINASINDCAALLGIVDKALSEQPYLSGDEIGMGDIPLGSFIYAWFEMPIERPSMPHLEAWYERLKLRPAYRNAVMTALT
ncbi:glutathione S-transferase [Pseudomonas endophytica]|uniref:Glutathione S-transferase n=1 Tax=Pseudomonas endophytica TaxID=1563157 RepID=A0A0Q0WZF9_9PSED|nr:glutathione S-transferase [Pseudomonas endophytica]KQB52832.1 glutathione S-transferase [Pseudomonas endophytica]